MRDDLTLMNRWHGVTAEKEKFMRWKISTNAMSNTLKTATKYSLSVRGRPTIKDEERSAFGTGWSANLTTLLREISL